MKIQYEQAIFSCSPNSSIERNLIKMRIKKSVGRWIGKPYRVDPYLSLCRKLLVSVPAPIVIDVGANIGTTVLPLAKQFPNGHFIAIEPHPLPAARFIQNCQMNALGNVSLVQAAIHSATGLTKIYTCSSNSGGHRLTGFEGRSDLAPLSALQYVSVFSLPLSRVFQSFNLTYCHVLKIDVEGMEWDVLESLGDFLTPSRIGTVIAEYGPEGMRKAGKSGWDLVHLMLSKGYRCQELTTGKSICCKEDIPALPDYTVTDFVFASTHF